MIASPATVVDLGALGEVVWVSLLAGVGLTATFSLAILGAMRAGAARRAGDTGSAAGYALLAALCGAAILGLLVLGVVVMLDK